LRLRRRALRIDNEDRARCVGRPTKLKAGDTITIDGSTGEVLMARCRCCSRNCPATFGAVMEWADATRRMKVRTNAETPADASVAREFGAEGIGLCRTEHMFFDGDRIIAMRQMILADDRGRPPQGARQAAADAARRLQAAVRDHGRPAGDDPPARSAAA
jgi:pyruvate,orthophosphate dikinase